MKVIVTGGGTGGHINPAIAIAEKIKEAYPEAELLYVGTEKGMESDLAPRAGLRFRAISVKGFRRKLSFDTVKTAATLVKGMGDAWVLLAQEKPRLVIGTGGYVCGPLVFLGALRGCRTLIHEQNVIPGATNRILSRVVNTVCTSYEETARYLRGGRRISLTGNPVRAEFGRLDKRACREKLGIPQDAFVVVSTGGSGGAGAVNRAVREVFQWNEDPQLYWIHITGRNYYPEFSAGLQESLTTGRLRAYPFSHEMPLLLGAADVAVGRAGALTLAELATCGLPAVLIPSPHVAHRHQDYNADVCSRAGMATVLQEDQLTGETLWEAVAHIQYDPGKLEAMRQGALSLSMAGAADRILEEVRSLLERRPKWQGKTRRP